MNPQDTLKLAIQHHRAGDLQAAEQLYKSILTSHPNSVEVLDLLGQASLQLNKPEATIDYLRKSVALGPDRPHTFYNLAVALWRCGHLDDASAYYRRVLSIDPDNESAYIALAAIPLPGANYYELLKNFHQFLLPRTYLEVGIRNGKSLALAAPPTICIGIDPEPKLTHSFSAETRIYDTTSDNFFSSHDPRQELGGKSIDLAFIDGMHHFEVALRDFANIERNATKKSVVLMHDCLPFDKVSSARDRATQFWSGDIWKVVPCLKRYRPELKIFTIATAPTGLGVITNLDPHSTVLQDDFDSIVSQFIDLDYDYLMPDKNKMLNVVPNDWPSIQSRVKQATSG